MYKTRVRSKDGDEAVNKSAAIPRADNLASITISKHHDEELHGIKGRRGGSEAVKRLHPCCDRGSWRGIHHLVPTFPCSPHELVCGNTLDRGVAESHVQPEADGNIDNENSEDQVFQRSQKKKSGTKDVSVCGAGAKCPAECPAECPAMRVPTLPNAVSACAR